MEVHRNMPGNYVRPESERLPRPRLAEVVSTAHLPVVDLATGDRDAVFADIRRACRTHGFFQVLNHGIDKDNGRLQIHEIYAKAREELAERLRIEKMANLHSDDPVRTILLSTSFNVLKETVHNYCRDFKETLSSFCKEARELGLRLYTAIFGVEPVHMEQHMAVNFYPPSPSPEVTYGLPDAHADPNAHIINNSDQLQARYRSVWDRAVWNLNNPRLSVASFLYGDDAGLVAFHDGQWAAVNPHPGAVIIGLSELLLQIRVEKSGVKAGDPIPSGANR